MAQLPTRWMVRIAMVAVASGAAALGLSSQASAAPSQDLQQAVRRDLGISYDEFVARGAQADRASQIDSALQGTPGYRGVSMHGDQITVAGEGNKVTRVADAQGARVTAEKTTAASPEPMLDTYLREVGADGLVSVAVTDSGWTITVDDPNRPRSPRPGAAATTPQAFAAQHPGVRLERGRPLAQRAQVLGGQGWRGPVTGGSVYCSVGFSGFSASGSPEMFSAGHCTRDGAVANALVEKDGSSLGSLRFGQFGGSSYGPTTPSSPGVDVSIYGAPASSVDLAPRTDTYTGSSTAVTGAIRPTKGAPVCTSGRTSKEWSCGTITSVEVFAVEGHRYQTDNSDVRWIKGFAISMVTMGGDSGGPIMSGNKAVGVLSAGDDYESFGSLLDPILARGDALELALPAPVSPTGAAGATVTGRVPMDAGDTVPSGTKVRVSVDGTTQQTVDVAADGTFRFTAPGSADAAVTLTAVNGFSTSPTTGWGIPVIGAIGEKWRALGAEKGHLGAPLAAEACGLRDRGCYQQFSDGLMYWSPATGAHPVWGAVLSAYQAQRWENGPLGYPTGDEVCGNGGCAQQFAGGTATWSSAGGSQWVIGAIGQRWPQLGAQTGALGWPTSIEKCGLVRQGCAQSFTGGRIYWSPASGAQPVWGAIGGAFTASGSENGPLGYPREPEYCGLRDGGCLQRFQNGVMYFSPTAGTHWVRGAIFDRWGSLGWETGSLGYPTSDERCGLVNGGCFQTFTGGSIYWSPASGTQPVWGAIGAYWASTGWERGRFGYPSGAESCDAGGCRQQFQRGTITWSPATGARG